MQTNSHPICIVSGTDWLTWVRLCETHTKNRVRSAALCVQILGAAQWSGLQSNVKTDFEGLRGVLATMGRARRHENTHRNSKSAHERTRAEDIERRKNPYGVCAGGIWDTPAQCTEIHQQLLSYGVIPTIWEYARWNCIARSVVSWKVAMRIHLFR